MVVCRRRFKVRVGFGGKERQEGTIMHDSIHGYKCDRVRVSMSNVSMNKVARNCCLDISGQVVI